MAALPLSREQLEQHQPYVGEGADQRIIYFPARHERIESEAAVARFVASHQSRFILSSPELQLLNETDIPKRLSPSSKSNSKSNSAYRGKRLVPQAASASRATHASDSICTIPE